MPLRIIGWRGVSVVHLAVLTFLLMAERCMTLRPTHHHHMHGRVKRVNKIGGPYIGLLMTFPTEEEALQKSGFFTPNDHIPWIDLAGRRFNVGKIKGVDVIYVMSGEQTVNAGITVQILVDKFHIKGIVHYGIAGSSNNSLVIGDVSIPKYVAFTDSWYWMEPNSESSEGNLTYLKFGDFNLPKPGGNALAAVQFSTVELYSVGNPMKKVFWLRVDPEWFAMASRLKNVTLDRCLNGTCVAYTPKVAYGLRGATANVYLHNNAYRNYLFSTFKVSTVDEESASVAVTSLSNAVPFIIFRGVSDFGGGDIDPAFSSHGIEYLAARNAAIAAVEFIALFNQ